MGRMMLCAMHCVTLLTMRFAKVWSLLVRIRYTKKWIPEVRRHHDRNTFNYETHQSAIEPTRELHV